MINIVFNDSFTAEEKSEVNVKLAKLMCDLGVSPNNQNVGSGVGGNENLFVFMQVAQHVFDDNVAEYSFADNTVSWNKKWFMANNIKTIRNAISDKDLEFKLEEHKEMLAFINNPVDRVLTIDDDLVFNVNDSVKDTYRKYFTLSNLLKSSVATKDNWKKLMLDMDSYPEYVILFGTRTYIGIQFLVANEVDEFDYSDNKFANKPSFFSRVGDMTA